MQRENAELEASAALAYCRAKWPQLEWKGGVFNDFVEWRVFAMVGFSRLEIYLTDNLARYVCECEIFPGAVKDGSDLICSVHRDTWQEAISALEAKLTALAAFIPVSGGEA